jgi:hypothetical protein
VSRDTVSYIMVWLSWLMLGTTKNVTEIVKSYRKLPIRKSGCNLLRYWLSSIASNEVSRIIRNGDTRFSQSIGQQPDAEAEA